MEDLKTRSFRITDETAEKIKELASQIGGNQQEVIAKLIETYEFQKGKAVLTSKKGDIEKFEQYVAILTRMFMNVLEENQNVTDTVHIEFEGQLKSKDLSIQSLQEENSMLKEEKTSYFSEAQRLIEENKSLCQQLETGHKESEEKKIAYESMLKDKEELNKALTSSINELQNDREEMQSKLKAADEIVKQVIEKTRQEEAAHLERVIQKAALENEKNLIKKEKEHQQVVHELKYEHQKEIDQYQKKYLDLLDKIQAKEDKAEGVPIPPVKKSRTTTKQSKD